MRLPGLLTSLALAVVVALPLGAQTETPEAPAPAPWDLKIGGALRFNYNLSDWKPAQVRRGGDFGFEVFRLTAEARYRKLELHLDQRFYAREFGGQFLKFGYFQIPLADERAPATPPTDDAAPPHDTEQSGTEQYLRLGLIPAYFGTQQFNSHSWFFALPFYLGFEDDHDMGISYTRESEEWRLDVGFYKNAEALNFSDSGPISDARYSYDVAERNKEVNTGTVRLIRTWALGGGLSAKLGTTLEVGGIYNLDTERTGTSLAGGLHGELNDEHWSVKAMVVGFDRAPVNAPGQPRDQIALTAYGAPYRTAASGVIYSLNVGYTWPLELGPVTALQLYNDYAYFDKGASGFAATQMNVSGVLVSAAPGYVYVDYARGVNHPWIGSYWEEGLAEGAAGAAWQTRFNVNFGYYF